MQNHKKREKEKEGWKGRETKARIETLIEKNAIKRPTICMCENAVVKSAGPAEEVNIGIGRTSE